MRKCKKADKQFSLLSKCKEVLSLDPCSASVCTGLYHKSHSKSQEFHFLHANVFKKQHLPAGLSETPTPVSRHTVTSLRGSTTVILAKLTALLNVYCVELGPLTSVCVDIMIDFSQVSVCHHS